jgi:hypothetical protein
MDNLSSNIILRVAKMLSDQTLQAICEYVPSAACLAGVAISARALCLGLIDHRNADEAV